MNLVHRLNVIEKRVDKMVKNEDHANEDFGEHIRTRRKQLNMSLDELSKLTELNKGYLSKVENNQRSTPKIENLKKLSEGLNVPYIELLIVSGYISKSDLEEYNNNSLQVVRNG